MAMAESVAGSTGRIFISYRREETAYPAGWLFDRLAGRFGAAQVFKDVDSIELGDDFVEVITRAVGSCDVLLALIGDQWVTIADERGRRRLDDPNDFVRLEIEAALSRGVRLIPILVGAASMPPEDGLPESLAPLVRRQALELSPARFDFDTSRLLKVLDRTLAEVKSTAQLGASIPTPMATAPDLSLTAPPEAPEYREPVKRGRLTVPQVDSDTARSSPSESEERSQKGSRRLSRQAQVFAGAGVAVVLLLVIVVIVATSSGMPGETGAISATPAGRAGPTETSPQSNAIIFQDDFSTQHSEWGPYGAPETGRYENGAYRISAPASWEGGGEGASPGNATNVQPAPSNIRIEVQGRRLVTSDSGMEYGIGCRVDGDNAYVFTISDNYAQIAKYGAKYRVLKAVHIPVDASSTNGLQAICAGVEGKQAVDLEFWVNGRRAIATTDADNPLRFGTVGLFVGTFRTKRVSLAEFDNFVVTLI
jgi:hypothetical protein